MRTYTILQVALLFGLTSISSRAACVDLSSATNWSNINTHKIIMYQGSKAVAILDISFCDIFPSSTIRLDKKVICSGDKIIVSGVACDIRSVKVP